MIQTSKRLKALVIGLHGTQVPALYAKVPAGVRLRHLTPDRSLKFRGDDSNLIVMTRFVSHKHEFHLRRIASCPVIVLRHGTANAVIKALELSLVRPA
jgi:hypothetical protein